ncbi:MAG: thiamine phosphate synthase [Candidatus Omnitrophota bacterium]
MKRNLSRNLRFYLIADWELCADKSFFLNKVKSAVRAGCRCVQLRAKNLDTPALLRLAETVRKLTKNKSLFIVNDRIDIALVSGADGVHIGHNDAPVDCARILLGRNKIIGCSVHSANQAFIAEQNGADYIGVGPIFKTTTKPQLTPIGPDIFMRLKNLKIPQVAIGGINNHTIRIARAKGAFMFAFASYIMRNKNPCRAMYILKQTLQRNIK